MERLGMQIKQVTSDVCKETSKFDSLCNTISTLLDENNQIIKTTFNNFEKALSPECPKSLNEMDEKCPDVLSPIETFLILVSKALRNSISDLNELNGRCRVR